MTVAGINALAIVLGCAASFATYAGGQIALRLGDRLPVLLALTAGIVLGVAFFDLIPEALGLAQGRYSDRTILVALAMGLALYLSLDLLLERSTVSRSLRAHLGPASLTMHSVTDGVGIGLAFQISHAIGMLVAVAVMAHDVADGINTISLARGSPMIARRWLRLNALAPLLGIVIGSYVRVPPGILAVLLAVFAGAFLYIGACELLPRSFAVSRHPATALATIFGMSVMYAVVRLV